MTKQNKTLVELIPKRIRRRLLQIPPTRVVLWLKLVSGMINRSRSRPDFEKHQRQMSKIFKEFKFQLKDRSWRLSPPQGTGKKLLVVAFGDHIGVIIELLFVKALQFSGFDPIILTERGSWAVRFYRYVGINNFVFWDDHLNALNHGAHEAVDLLISGAEINDIVN